VTQSLPINLIRAVTLSFVVAFSEGCKKTSKVDLLGDAAQNGDMATVASLVDEGTPINLPSSFRFHWTPLIAAIYADKTNVVYYLVDHGANVNVPDKDGVTPLMWQTVHGDDELALYKYLIAHGADLNAKDHRGSTVLSYAQSLPPKPKIIEVLEQNGVNSK
jgi:ankyrin repeat protein